MPALELGETAEAVRPHLSRVPPSFTRQVVAVVWATTELAQGPEALALAETGVRAQRVQMELQALVAEVALVVRMIPRGYLLTLVEAEVPV